MNLKTLMQLSEAIHIALEKTLYMYDVPEERRAAAKQYFLEKMNETLNDIKENPDKDFMVRMSEAIKKGGEK